jgi:hypothetical protein
MNQMNVLDLLNVLPLPTAEEMMSDRSAMSRGIFNLACSAERLQELMEERYQGLANALRITAKKLYELVQLSLDESNGETVLCPGELKRSFQRFENVLFCLNDIREDFVYDSAGVHSTWHRIQEHYQELRYVMVKNPNFIF